MFVFCEDECADFTCYDSDWVIISGASYHGIPHRNSSCPTLGIFMLRLEMKSHAKLLALDIFIWIKTLGVS